MKSAWEIWEELSARLPDPIKLKKEQERLEREESINEKKRDELRKQAEEKIRPQMALLQEKLKIAQYRLSEQEFMGIWEAAAPAADPIRMMQEVSRLSRPSFGSIRQLFLSYAVFNVNIAGVVFFEQTLQLCRDIASVGNACILTGLAVLSCIKDLEHLVGFAACCIGDCNFGRSSLLGIHSLRQRDRTPQCER